MVEQATFEIPAHLLQAAHTTPDELKIEIAVHLYQQRRLSIFYWPRTRISGYEPVGISAIAGQPPYLTAL